jgi:hypothetical protein
VSKVKKKMQRVIKTKAQFAEWLYSEGLEAISIELDLDYSTVFYWAKGTYIPNAKNMLRLHELSDGSIKFSAIIREHSKKSKK